MCSSSPGKDTSPASLASPPVEEMVRQLWDRQQISDVMLRFGRGLDTRDWDMARNI